MQALHDLKGGKGLEEDEDIFRLPIMREERELKRVQINLLRNFAAGLTL